MTHPRPLRRFDPFRPIDMLTSLWSSAAMAPVSSGAAAAYRTLFMTVRRLVVGRRMAVHLDDGELTVTVTEFDSRLDVRGLSVGQLNDVRLAARDIRWDGKQFDRATAVLHNVHMRPSAPPVLVAAPVELTLEVPAAVLDDLFRWAAPRLSGEVGPDGIARLRLARRPMLGHLEVDARLDGSTLWLKPRGLVIRRSRWTLPARTPAYPVRLPSCRTVWSSPASASRPTWCVCRARCRNGGWMCRENAGGHPQSAQRRWRAAESDQSRSAPLTAGRTA